MKTPIKFSKTGPEGWMNDSNVALETTKLIEGTSNGLDHVYYENKETEVTSGIWC